MHQHDPVFIEVTGFEPATSASRTRRYTKLSHTSNCLKTSYFRGFPGFCTFVKNPLKSIFVPLKPFWLGSQLGSQILTFPENSV